MGLSVMIDLETFGDGPNAVVVQMAAVAFEARSGGRVHEGTALNLYVEPDSCLGASYTGETVTWWLGQSAEARLRLLAGLKHATTMQEALVALEQWPSTIGPGGWGAFQGVWANSPSFDCTILDSACRCFGRRLPWDFRKQRDLRTAFLLLGDPPAIDVGGVRHDALTDCVWQISALQAVLGTAGRSL